MQKPSKDNDAAAAVAVGRPNMVLEWRTVSPKPHSNLISMGRPKTMMIILVAAEYHTTVESMPT